MTTMADWRKKFDAAAEDYDKKLNKDYIKIRDEIIAEKIRGCKIIVDVGASYPKDGVVVLDFSRKMIAKIREIQKERYKSVRCVVGDANNLPFKSCVDAVVCCETLYYLDSPEKFVAECSAVMRDGGILIICSLNQLWRFFYRIREVFRRGGEFPRKFFYRSEIENMMRKFGFGIEDSIGLFPVMGLRILEKSPLRNFAFTNIIIGRKEKEV